MRVRAHSSSLAGASSSFRTPLGHPLFQEALRTLRLGQPLQGSSVHQRGASGLNSPPDIPCLDASRDPQLCPGGLCPESPPSLSPSSP